VEPQEKSEMKPKFQCSVTASFLDSGQVLANAGHAAAVVAGVGVALEHSLAVRLLFAFSILCWPVGCYFAVRVAVDRSLFRVLAGDPENGGRLLDELLQSWSFAKGGKERSMEDRSRGALALLRRLAIFVTVQLAALVAGILLQTVDI
jgi:hypothetical protein